jgi:hypothetical protein
MTTGSDSHPADGLTPAQEAFNASMEALRIAKQEYTDALQTAAMKFGRAAVDNAAKIIGEMPVQDSSFAAAEAARSAYDKYISAWEIASERGRALAAEKRARAT